MISSSEAGSDDCLQSMGPKNSETMTVKISAYGGPGLRWRLRRATRLGSGLADKDLAGTLGIPAAPCS